MKHIKGIVSVLLILTLILSAGAISAAAEDDSDLTYTASGDAQEHYLGDSNLDGIISVLDSRHRGQYPNSLQMAIFRQFSAY